MKISRAEKKGMNLLYKHENNSIKKYLTKKRTTNSTSRLLNKCENLQPILSGFEKSYYAELTSVHNSTELELPFYNYAETKFKKRLQNLDEIKSLSERYIKQKFSKDFLTSFGVENLKGKDLPQLNSNSRNNFMFNFTYSNEFRNDLIENVVKYKYKKPEIVKKGDKIYSSSYYIGYYKGQIVLFKELMFKDKNKFNSILTSGSYELTFVVNGKDNGQMLLFRMDYNPIRNHPNKLLKDENFGSENYYQKLKNIETFSHIHKLTLKYSLLFPSCLNSCDATKYNSTKKEFDEEIKILKKKYKILNNKEIFTNSNDSIKKEFADYLIESHKSKVKDENLEENL